MTTQRQNKRGDFVFRMTFQNQAGETVEPPQRVDIRFTTEEKAGTFDARFLSDGSCLRCKRVPEGIDVFVALSRQYIGAGRMLMETVSIVPDKDFDGGEKRVASKVSTSVLLWDGPSDGDMLVTGTIIL